MVNAMYAAFVRHHIKPSEFYCMSPSERAITCVFLQKEIDDEQEAMKKAK